MILLLIEKYVFTKRFFFSDKDSVIIKLELIGVVMKILFSTVIFFPLLGLLIPFNLISLSNWDIHPALNFLGCFLLLDFFHYLSHRLHHSIPLLWRFHRLHHSDKDVDVMTTWLHHPFELISIYLINTFLYVVFDIPIEFIYIYSIIFILHSGFTHIKIYVPENIDNWLRFMIITPNAHRLHHSIDMKEGNSNFGLILLVWDIIFKTYLKNDSKHITFGVKPEVTPQTNNLWNFIINPFKKEST
jgi:sterol desaturase/sphingolipid hydroxylase (fatty acid hydroxylase superfamily)